MKEIKDYMANTCKLSKEDQSALILDSYVVKTKSSGIKNFTLLQRMNAAYSATKDEKKKPLDLSFSIYDFTKGGIAIPVQKMGFYSWMQKTRKGTLVTVACVLDITGINSQIVFTMNDNVSNTKSFGFAWDLMKALVKLHRKCFLF